MRKFGLTFILGLILLAGQSHARAAAPLSEWPSLNADATQSNQNPFEHVLTAHNVLKLRVRPWALPDPTASYPIVANGTLYMPVLSHRQIFVQPVDLASGKKGKVFTKQAAGGMLAAGGSLYVAGKILQGLDPRTGQRSAQVTALRATARGTFLDPVSDRHTVLAGYYAPASGHPFGVLYAYPPDLSRTLWHAGSIRAQGTLASGRVLTDATSGDAIYDSSTGKRLAREASLHSDWFAGSVLNYTIGSLHNGPATLYAFDGTGRRTWSVKLGPRAATQGWPYAVGPNAIFVQSLLSGTSILAVDPETGQTIWKQHLAEVEHLVVANGVVYALSYQLGAPVRLFMLHADTGKVIGAIVLSSNYYAFPALNGLMVADGMVFMRVVGPAGPVVLVLGL